MISEGNIMKETKRLHNIKFYLPYPTTSPAFALKSYASQLAKNKCHMNINEKYLYVTNTHYSKVYIFNNIFMYIYI